MLSFNPGINSPVTTDLLARTDISETPESKEQWLMTQDKQSFVVSQLDKNSTFLCLLARSTCFRLNKWESKFFSGFDSNPLD